MFNSGVPGLADAREVQDIQIQITDEFSSYCATTKIEVFNLLLKKMSIVFSNVSIYRMFYCIFSPFQQKYSLLVTKLSDLRSLANAVEDYLHAKYTCGEIPMHTLLGEMLMNNRERWSVALKNSQFMLSVEQE